MLPLPIQLQPSPQNTYPVQGLLLRGADPAAWLTHMAALGLSPLQTLCYPVPGQQPGQWWGAVLYHTEPLAQTAPHQGLQVAHGLLLLPEQSRLVPALDAKALDTLLLGKPHLLHPTLGLVELFEAVDWTALIQAPPRGQASYFAPEAGYHAPQRLRSLSVSAGTIQESLAQLDQAALPPPHIQSRPPLTPLEKRRLEQLRRWRQAHHSPPPKGWLGKLLQATQRAPEWTPELEDEWQALEERQPPSKDRLLELLKKDPEKGLPYAPPLNDGSGLGRGQGLDSSSGHWSWMPRWLSDSLSNWEMQGFRQGGRYQASLVNEDVYEQLRKQYEQTAKDLAAQGKYDKAAFVYLRLLRDPHRAVDMLEKGGLYAQAASVCLEFLKDIRRAADNAFRAQQWERALQLYQELGDGLALGRVYERLDQPQLARQAYEQVLAEWLQEGEYEQAATFALERWDDRTRAKAIYEKAWHKTHKTNYLRAYLELLEQPALRQATLLKAYEQDINEPLIVPYLQLLLHYRDSDGLPQDWLYHHAHAIMAQHMGQAAVSQQLLYWQPDNRFLNTDILRYRRQERARKKHP